MKTLGLIGGLTVQSTAVYYQNLHKAMRASREDCKALDDILFAELAYGNIREESRKVYLDVIQKAELQGADSIILGCTGFSCRRQECLAYFIITARLESPKRLKSLEHFIPCQQWEQLPSRILRQFRLDQRCSRYTFSKIEN